MKFVLHLAELKLHYAQRHCPSWTLYHRKLDLLDGSLPVGIVGPSMLLVPLKSMDLPLFHASTQMTTCSEPSIQGALPSWLQFSLPSPHLTMYLGTWLKISATSRSPGFHSRTIPSVWHLPSCRPSNLTPSMRPYENCSVVSLPCRQTCLLWMCAREKAL